MLKVFHKPKKYFSNKYCCRFEKNS